MSRTVVSIDSEARRVEQYNDIMANVTPMMVEGVGRNQKILTGGAYVPTSCCFIDTRYQRKRTEKQLNKFRNKFDKTKVMPITLVPHPEEHRFAVVDGQKRVIVCPEMGMDRLFATILMNAPDDIDERTKFEADRFINQDSEVENVKSLEKHPARVINGDKAAVILENLLSKYNIIFVSTKGQRGKSVLGSYTATYSIAQVHGEKCLDFIFSIIENAGWNKEKNGYATFIMNALKEIWVEHPVNRNEIHTYLSKVLRQIDPYNFGASAKVKYAMRDYRMSYILYMEDLVCNGLGIEKRICMNEDKRRKILK